MILHKAFYEKLVNSYSEHDFRIVFGYDYISFISFKWGGGLTRFCQFSMILIMCFHDKFDFCHQCLCFTLAGL